MHPEGLAGLDVKLDGFSHKLPLLARRVFQCIASCQFDAKSFAAVKEALVRKYRNANMQVGRHEGQWRKITPFLRDLDAISLH